MNITGNANTKIKQILKQFEKKLKNLQTNLEESVIHKLILYKTKYKLDTTFKPQTTLFNLMNKTLQLFFISHPIQE